MKPTKTTRTILTQWRTLAVIFGAIACAELTIQLIHALHTTEQILTNGGY